MAIGHTRIEQPDVQAATKKIDEKEIEEAGFFNRPRSFKKH